jgi:hypothetical protein
MAMVSVVFTAVMEVLMLLFAVAVGAFDVFGHIGGSDPNEGAFFDKIKRFGEENPSMPRMVAFDPRRGEHQIGISPHILKNDPRHAKGFKVFDHLAAALEAVVPERHRSGLIDQGKPFGFAEQGGDGTLEGAGFEWYSDHAKSFR